MKNKFFILSALLLVLSTMAQAHELVPIKSSNQQCLDVHWNDYDAGINGAKIQMWDCYPQNPNQKWQYQNGQVISQNGKCLDVHWNDYWSGKDGAKVQMWRCFPQNPNQKWRYQDGQIISQNGKCLDVHRLHYDDKRNEALVHLWGCNNHANQQWSIAGLPGRPGTIRSSNGKCLDIHWEDYIYNRDGAKIQLWDCNFQENQYWYVNDIPNTQEILCESWNSAYKFCSTNGAIASIWIKRQHSNTICVRGTNWGHNNHGVWVNQGCRATFSYTVSQGGGQHNAWISNISNIEEPRMNARRLVEVSVQNTGASTWSRAAMYRLGVTSNNQLDIYFSGHGCGGYRVSITNARVFLCRDVAPGESYTFKFAVQPTGTVPGNQRLEVQMVKDSLPGAWFGNVRQSDTHFDTKFDIDIPSTPEFNWDTSYRNIFLYDGGIANYNGKTALINAIKRAARDYKNNTVLGMNYQGPLHNTPLLPGQVEFRTYIDPFSPSLGWT